MKQVGRREDKQKRERRPWFTLDRLPVVYRHFVLVSSVLLMSILMLVVSSQVSLNTLRKNNINDLQYRLEQNCQFISNTFSEAYSIPSIIEQTRYYSYIKSENDGYLPEKYAAVLAYMGKSLQIPNFLSRDSDECLVYLRGTNSICGKNNVFFTAEECFDTHLMYEETDAETIIGILQGRNGLHILPMETLKIGTANPKRQMTVIICDSTVPISVLCTYSENAILKHLEIESFPEDTFLQITASGGDVLEAYPALVTDEVLEQSYQLEAELPYLHASVTMWIPKSYCDTLLQSSINISWLIILVTAVMGFALSIILARASAKPLQNLVLQHSANHPVEQHPNELLALSNILQSSQAETENLENVLFNNLLARAFSGSLISKEDAKWLQQKLNWNTPGYRVALCNIDKECNGVQLAAHLQERMPQVLCSLISEWELGILLSDSDAAMLLLQQELLVLKETLSQNQHHICCGVSQVMTQWDLVHVAVRQARNSIKHSELISVFSGRTKQLKTVTWLQHERLYQDILAGNQENARFILEEIISEAHSHNTCHEIFYNIRFVLCSAAEEMELSFPDSELPTYEAEIPSWENVRKLCDMLDTLFEEISLHKIGHQADTLSQILSHIEGAYTDPNLCLQSVAEEFELSPKRVYNWVLEATGVRFNEYVLALRMKKACALLCTTQLSVEQVAERSGFLAESTFYRVFKKYYGVTPKQCRKSGGVMEKQKKDCPEPEDE